MISIDLTIKSQIYYQVVDLNLEHKILSWKKLF